MKGLKIFSLWLVPCFVLANTGEELTALARQAVNQQAYTRAETYYQQALNLYAQQADSQAQQIEVLLQLAVLAYQQGQYTQATPLLKQGLTLCETTISDTDNCLSILHNLGAAYQAQDDFSAAEPFYSRLLSAQEARYGVQSVELVSTLSALAVLYYQQGRYPEARTAYQHAIQLQIKQGDTRALLPLLEALAELQFTRFHDLNAAKTLYEQILLLRDSQQGSLELADVLNLLGLIHFQQADYSRAELFYQRALALREKLLGAEHPDVAVSLNNLAKLYMMQANYIQAKPLYERAIQILEKQAIPNNPILRKVQENLALLITQINKK
ncbi:tetratricopeptide repeat protein [Beggiatoa leptomitoformis]|uniref:Tetratricopeptide repeat protein n=1 Tax=Beggiatoa leptomitoformis TaxID=288004 RepID=A0A2N9YBS6_9GAMM|nr:tetratricopeptide repeat protein [Beggiatoa leptomitoformis]ALG66720.1 tetratricopeptide repeat protein [Beggiatoa leptomitoformis]AUI67947.1 tetratricopeptide repeat protein [Beggiatoa leptomitoformis]